jgi:hypothetical protein
MSFIQSFVAKAEVALPRYFNVLNLLSLMLLGVALLLPITSALIVLVLSMLIQAAFFRVMYREKVGISKETTGLPGNFFRSHICDSISASFALMRF